MESRSCLTQWQKIQHPGVLPRAAEHKHLKYLIEIAPPLQATICLFLMWLFFSCKYCLEFVSSLPKQSFDVNSLVSPISWWIRATIWPSWQIGLKWPTAQLEQYTMYLTSSPYFIRLTDRKESYLLQSTAFLAKYIKPLPM